MKHYPFRFEYIAFPVILITSIYGFVFLVEAWSLTSAILPLKHNLLWVGVLSVSLYLVYSGATDFYLHRGLRHEPPRGMRHLTGLTLGSIVFFGGIAVLTGGVLSLFNSQNDTTSREQFINTLSFLLPLQVVAMLLFCLNSLWRIKYLVEEQHVVILDTGIHPEGSNVSLSPWRNYERAIIPRSLPIQLEQVGVCCKDGSSFLTAKAWVQIDLSRISDNELLEQAGIDRLFFEKELKIGLQEALQTMAAHWTLAQLVEARFPVRIWYIVGVPCRWDGNFQLKSPSQGDDDLLIPPLEGKSHEY